MIQQDTEFDCESFEDISSQLITIFSVPYHERTPQQRSKTIELAKKTDFFASKVLPDLNDNKFLAKSTALMKLERMAPGEAIYHQNDPAIKIYILLKGRVRRYIPRTADELKRDEKVAQIFKPITPPPVIPEPRISVLKPLQKVTSMLRNISRLGNVSPKNKQSGAEPRLSESPIHRKSILSTIVRNSHEPTSKHNLNGSDLDMPVKILINHSTQELDMSPAKRMQSHLTLNLSQRASPINGMPFTNSLSSSPETMLSTNASKQPQFSFHLVASKLISSNIPKEPMSASPQIPKNNVVNFEPKSAGARPAKKKEQSENDFDEIEAFSKFSNHISKYFIAGAFRFKHVKTYRPGEAFGELGLTFDSTRIATLVAESECYLLTIEKDNFLSIFEDKIVFTREKIEFLEQFFPEVPSKSVSDFSSYFRRMKFGYNEMIYQQGDSVDGIYFIHEGEVFLEKQIQIERDTKNPLEKLTPRGLTGSVERNVRVTTLGHGQLFGEEELLKQKHRVFTTKVAGPKTIVFRVSRKNFSTLKQFYPGIITHLKEKVNLRKQWRAERLGSIDLAVHHDIVSKAPSLADERSTEIIQKMSQLKPELYSSIKRKTSHHRVSTLNKKGILEKGPISELEEEYYDRMVTLKSKMTHDKVHLRSQMELNTPRERSYSTGAALSLWRTSLVQRNSINSKLLLKHRYDESKQLNSIKEKPKKDLSIDVLPAKGLRSYLEKVVESQSTRHLYSKEGTNYKVEELPRMLKNFSLSLPAIEPISYQPSLQNLSRRENNRLSPVVGIDAQKPQESLEKHQSMATREDAGDSICIWSWGSPTPTDREQKGKKHKNAKSVAVMDQKISVSVNASLVIRDEPYSLLNPVVDRRSSVSPELNYIESHTGSQHILLDEGLVFLTAKPERSSKNHDKTPGVAAQKKQISSNHNMFRPCPKNLEQMRTFVKKQYK